MLLSPLQIKLFLNAPKGIFELCILFSALAFYAIFIRCTNHLFLGKAEIVADAETMKIRKNNRLERTVEFSKCNAALLSKMSFLGESYLIFRINTGDFPKIKIITAPFYGNIGEHPLGELLEYMLHNSISDMSLFKADKYWELKAIKKI